LINSRQAIPIDVRIIAATHRDLNALVADGKFREDLLYRPNVVPIDVPTLRERVADIAVLVEYFIDRFGKKAGKRLWMRTQELLGIFCSSSTPWARRKWASTGSPVGRCIWPATIWAEEVAWVEAGS
jgi:formate hydrogenlyase transcriptional activator